jgi:hypothetical protein
MKIRYPSIVLLAAAALAMTGLTACSYIKPFDMKPIGIIYTNIRTPLTTDLHNTPVPVNQPNDGRTIEIREPITGVGLYAQVDSNAIGDIAHEHGMHTLYFADLQTFSILGIWATNKTILYGK